MKVSKSRSPIFATASAAFTLLELLIVVTILAIVGGSMLVAFNDLDDTASEGVAAHTIASLEAAVRTYVNYERAAPNALDSLLAADYDPAGNVTMTGAAKVAILPSKLHGSKLLGPLALTAGQAASLVAAGITELRYVDPLGNDFSNPAPGSTVTLSATTANGTTPGVVGALEDIDIPHRIFEDPRPGSGQNRGRGFRGLVAAGAPVLVWNPDRAGSGDYYDNAKLGAGPSDVLIVFGLGNSSTIVGATKGRAQLASAPVFGKVEKKYNYGRYLLVMNVGPAGAEFEKARFQCILNTHGDFVDEMISEHLGQKN